jgi:isoquinoline 1-oxidoreductase beta subunit
VPYGFWRSVGSSVNGYVTEAFIDEIATAAGKDPYEFRRALLVKHPRHRAVLDMTAEKANWKTAPAPGRARGIAVHECFGSIIGLACEVSVTNGTVRVHRNVCVVDCGWVVHPDTIKAQMEGGLAYGLTAALKGEITINKGRVVQSHFGDYQPLRHPEMPQTECSSCRAWKRPAASASPAPRRWPARW